MYRNPLFPSREMYSNVPGPVLLDLRRRSTQILSSNFDDDELQEGRDILSQNDPIPNQYDPNQ